MWNITVYSNENSIIMYEFNTEKEAREAFNHITGCKILSEIVYFNDPCFALEPF
ncbi:hypothetical protein FB550_101202 [Neobacillus bataviensis]|uniref:Uncharacterized protein n=1 Tax=Neobacillus bataviensis TaxID=220685 RepID=A0A561DXU5_9BACI|nr:hypothetical protein [Neobacillus bataviensis]TWE08188.1 hypothetical protein FB550_101202 [Neobacillus bataviensis]